MNILQLFGIGSQKILEKDCSAEGIVIDRYRCWWCKVNTKAVRLHSFDGAVFPHIITFSYSVNQTSYTGKLWVGVRWRAPLKGEHISVYYDPENPGKYACYTFGPGEYTGI